MCFCETNRIGFSVKTGDNILRWNWIRSKRWEISIRFVWMETKALGSRDSNIPPTFKPRIENGQSRLSRRLGVPRGVLENVVRVVRRFAAEIDGDLRFLA